MRKNVPTAVLRRCLLLLFASSVQCFAFGQELASLSREANPKDRQALTAQDQAAKQELKKVLEEIGAQYQVNFIFDNQLLDQKMVVAPNGSNSLEAGLREMLKPLGLSFKKLDDNNYIIRNEERENLPIRKVKSHQYHDPETNLPANLANNRIGEIMAKTQRILDQTISGTVTDLTDNSPLPGVNIVAKGTTTGTVTDIDGNYQLSVPDETEVLVFSSVGYTSEEVTIGSQTVINIAMAPDIQSLSEVVVVGYGTQKKSDLTGAVSSIEPQDITRVSERRLETALQGRAAGVQVVRGEGSPGASSKVTIRGAGSIGDTDPLWIVDGVPQNPGNYFNMNDVESIEILKDASAAAIYGARAAHGVILVTTKRGAEGKVNVNFNTSVGQRQAVRLPNMLGTGRYIEGLSEARRNANIAPEPSWANSSELPNTNWADELFDPAIEQTYNLSVSGGNQNANFFISGAYDKEEGIMIDNYFERFSVRANSDFKIGEKIKIGESLLVSRTDENPTAEDARDLEFVYRAVPTMPVRDLNNPLGGWGQAPPYFAGSNPVGRQLQNHILNRNTRINGNVYAEIEPIKGLTLRGSFGANITARVEREFNEAFNYGQLAGGNQLTYLNTNDNSSNANLVLTYTKTIGDHNFTVLGGYERFRGDGIQFNARATDFPIAYAESFALATGEVINIPTRNTIDNQYRLQSFFGRINYSFANKYLLSANVRRDGSSRFGSENQYGVFPSVSVGWRIIEEGFMQSVTFLSDLKLRASYGVLGSDRIGDYIFSRTYSTDRSSYVFDASGVYGGEKDRGFYLRRFPNEEVQWEEVRQIDIGVDVGFLEGRFNLTADYYIKTTTDMLIGVQLPASFGVSRERDNPQNVPINLGEMENRGFELALNYRQNYRDWRFDISGNVAWNRNEVKSLNEDDRILRGGGGPGINGGFSLTEAGQPVSTFYGYQVEGIFQSYDEIREHADQGASPFDEEGMLLPEEALFNRTAPGDLKYRDIDEDGDIDDDDRTYIGNPWPKMAYGLNATIGYKNLDLTLFFQGVQGVDMFNASKAYYRSFYSDYNSTDLVYERWTAENPTGNPRLHANDPNGNFNNPSSYHVDDGSYLKLRNIQLGYTLPEAVISRVNLTNARIFVNAQNILTLTKYDGLDPELSDTGSSGNTRQGVDTLGQYPQTRLVSAGLQIGF